MPLRSVYVPIPAIENDRIRITGEEHRHLVVARAEKGEEIEIFDGRGGVWNASVESAGKRDALAVVTDYRKVPPDPIELILALALVRTAAFEFALEKAVEAGVTRIIPFSAARSNMTLGKRHERWLRIVIEAAKQSKRYHLPRLDEIAGFKQILATSASSKILFAERGGGPLKSALASSPALYLIGPEGGWTDAESELARQYGFKAVSLGPTILKTETAAIVGAALILYEMRCQSPR